MAVEKCAAEPEVAVAAFAVEEAAVVAGCRAALAAAAAVRRHTDSAAVHG